MQFLQPRENRPQFGNFSRFGIQWRGHPFAIDLVDQEQSFGHVIGNLAAFHVAAATSRRRRQVEMNPTPTKAADQVVNTVRRGRGEVLEMDSASTKAADQVTNTKQRGRDDVLDEVELTTTKAANQVATSKQDGL